MTRPCRITVRRFTCLLIFVSLAFTLFHFTREFRESKIESKPIEPTFTDDRHVFIQKTKPSEIEHRKETADKTKLTEIEHKETADKTKLTVSLVDSKNVGCRLPDLDPFDPRIMKYVSAVSDVQCHGRKPATLLDESGRLTVDERVCKENAISEVQYRFITRPKDDDFKAEKGDWKLLWRKDQPVNPVSLPEEDFIQIQVTGKEGTHIEVHVRAAPKEEVQKRPVMGGGMRKPGGLPMNVLMIMFDSVSHHQFQRRAGRVYKYLKNDPNSVILNGQTVVGDGTTAQLTGILTGVPEAQNPESRRSFSNAVTVDTWPFIFPVLKKHGYATLFSEDEPTLGAFTYRLRGFRDPPTDHYGRYFWIGVGEAKKGYCLENKKSHDVQFKYVESLHNIYPKNPKFSFIVMSELTHNSPNRVQLVDDDLIEFLLRMKALGHLNNTMVLIMSDHGSRYQGIRQTVQGKLEERLPMFSFMMPPWFTANHPDLFANLKENSKHLSTPFDIHATLSHIMSYPNLPPREKETFGQSLFSKIDLSRGCEEAGVDFHWCPCLSYTDVNVSSAQAKDAALTVVHFMNNLTLPQQALCEKLTLQEIRYVGRLTVHKKVHQFIGNKNRVPQFNNQQVAGGDGEIFEIHLSTLPNNGFYEATAKLVHGKFHILGEISRVNAYGNQPKCIADTHVHLLKFCYCKKQ